MKIIKWFELNLGWFFVNGRKRAQWAEYLRNKYNDDISDWDVTLTDGLDEPFGYATTAELMLMFGKGVDEALDIHNHLEKIAKGDDV